MNTPHWFIAIVPNNTEKSSYEKLAKTYEVFLPAQKYVSVWKDGRRKLRDRILLPGMLLIHCTEAERQKTMQNYSFVKRYMIDIASSKNEFGYRKIAIVPDNQVESLRLALSQNEATVEIDNVNLSPGEKVRVFRGTLAGLEGEVSDWQSKKARIYIKIQHLGTASLEVNLDDVERIKE